MRAESSEVATTSALSREPLLDFSHVAAGYGKFDVLKDVSIHVDPGELVAIIGPNGAGKSTVLKAIMGMLRVSEGRIEFAGQEITGRRTDQLVRVGLGYVHQG